MVRYNLALYSSRKFKSTYNLNGYMDFFQNLYLNRVSRDLEPFAILNPL